MPTAVLTRDLLDAQPYADALAPLGLDAVAMPVSKTESTDDPDALVRALADGTYSAILVASPRAAHELARAHARSGAIALPTIWAVGPATQRELEIAKLPAHLPDGVRDGGDLATRLAQSRDLRGHRVLVPRAEHSRIELLDVLRDAGAIVVDVIAYRSVAAAKDDPAVQAGAALLAAGGASVCCVFAPSQVAALLIVVADRVVGAKLSGIATRFCAIGDTTAAALRAAGIAEVAVAPAPTPEGMAHAVGSVYPPRT